MFTILILLVTLWPCTVDNINAVLTVSTADKHKVPLLIKENCKVPKVKTQDSNNLLVFSEESHFLNNNDMMQYRLKVNVNMCTEKDNNECVQDENNHKIVTKTEVFNKYMQSDNKYKQQEQTQLNQAVRRDSKVLKVLPLRLASTSVYGDKLLVKSEENSILPIHVSKNLHVAKYTLNKEDLTETSDYDCEGIQIGDNQTLIRPTIENFKWHMPLRSKPKIKMNKLDKLNIKLHTQNIGTANRYTAIEGKHQKFNSLQESNKKYMQTTEIERFIISNKEKRHIHTEYSKIHIPNKENFKWPEFIEESVTVSSITSNEMNLPLSNESNIPIDIIKLKDKDISEPVEDNRVITTLKHSQIRVELKIVHGSVAQAKDFPFLVSIKRAIQKISKTKKLWKNYCGGSIINSEKVLTAAHCFEMNKYDYYYHSNKLRVVAGSLINKLYHSGNTSNTNKHQVRQIKLVKLHHDFNFPLNDIALVFVDEPFRFDHPMNINYIVPARYHTDYASQCYAAGFGQTRPKSKDDGSEELLWAEISLMSRSQCNNVWEMDMLSFLCSRSVLKSVSGGDSGGPLACFNSLDPSANKGSGKLLVGIVSGRNYDKTTLYTRVSAYRKWIDSNCSCIREYRITLILFALIKAFCTLYF